MVVNMEQDIHLVGVRECARRLGVNASTISRQVAKGIITNRGTPDAPLIDMATVEAERAAGLDQSKQRGVEAPLFSDRPAAAPSAVAAEPEASEVDDDEPPPANAEQARAKLKYTDARTYREGYAAKLAELQYRREIDELVGAAGAEQGYADAGRILRDRLLSLPAQLAASLAAMTDEAEIAAYLRERIKRALTEAADEAGDVDELDDGDDGADEPARAGADRVSEPEGIFAR